MESQVGDCRGARRAPRGDDFGGPDVGDPGTGASQRNDAGKHGAGELCVAACGQRRQDQRDHRGQP